MKKEKNTEILSVFFIRKIDEQIKELEKQQKNLNKIIEEEVQKAISKRIKKEKINYDDFIKKHSVGISNTTKKLFKKYNNEIIQTISRLEYFKKVGID